MRPYSWGRPLGWSGPPSRSINSVEGDRNDRTHADLEANGAAADGQNVDTGPAHLARMAAGRDFYCLRGGAREVEPGGLELVAHLTKRWFEQHLTRPVKVWSMNL